MLTLFMLPLFCVLLPVIVVLGVIGLVFGIGCSILPWLLKGLGGFILLAVILAILFRGCRIIEQPVGSGFVKQYTYNMG